ncbi:MAG: tyrosine-type recombinase/integrase [Acidobacteriota bacterium]
MAGQVIEKGKRKWLVRIFLGRGGNGKRSYFNKLIHGTKKDAEGFLSRTLTEISQGKFMAPSTNTLDDYLNEWLKNSAKQKLSQRTYDHQVYCLDRYVRPVLGGRKLSTIKPLDLQELYTRMGEDGLSPRTIQIVHNILNRAFNQAVRWQVMAFNPAQLADRPKQERKEMLALAPEQAGRFLKAAREDLYYLYFAMALDTGARPSELLGLQWKDVDFEQGRITIQRSLEYPDYSNVFRFVEPKTSRSRRSITISQNNLNSLREHRREQGEKRLKKGADWQQHDLVFCTREGKPIQARNILRRHMRPILKAAELPETLNLYSLRHSCATLLLSAGTNPKIVSERLGHARIVLTLDTYSHVLPDMQQEASDRLEKILFGEVGTPEAHQKEKAAG